MNVLAIDFGTSSTVGVLAVAGQVPRPVEIDGSVTMPSAVCVNDDCAYGILTRPSCSSRSGDAIP